MLLDKPEIRPEELKRLRVRVHHISQQELAERAGLSLGQVNRIERGEIPSPHYSTIRKLARALEVEPEDLTKWDEA